MQRNLCIIFPFLIIPLILSAQIWPSNGSILNYRLIGFAFPANQLSGSCLLEVAKGSYNSDVEFNKNIIKKKSCKTNRLILEVPSFGAEYTWRTVCASGKAAAAKSELHHFSTGTIPELDSNTTRLRILKHASKSKKDAFVIIEASKVMYDMEGHPVWYLPDTVGNPRALNDLRVSPQGTLTYLEKGNACEINYNGNLLWQAPNTGEVSGDTLEHYHHEFTRLSNGHYMVLGNQFADCKIELATDGTSRISILSSRKHEINESVLERQPIND